MTRDGATGPELPDVVGRQLPKTTHGAICRAKRPQPLQKTSVCRVLPDAESVWSVSTPDVPFCAAARMAMIVVLARCSGPDWVRSAAPTASAVESCSVCLAASAERRPVVPPLPRRTYRVCSLPDDGDFARCQRLGRTIDRD